MKSNSKSVVLIACLLTLLMTSCRGPAGNHGSNGSQGDKGDKGDPGDPGNLSFTLLKTYTGVIDHNGTTPLNVPEIYGKAGTTFVEAYWAFPTSPEVFVKIPDGVPTDDAFLYARVVEVSWDYGRVYMFHMVTGEHYKICVYAVTSNAAPSAHYSQMPFGSRLLD